MFCDFITKNTDFFVEKNERSFCSQFFNKKYWHISDTDVWNFNETLTNDVVIFEQSGPGPEVIKLFSCSTQLSMNFFLLINIKKPHIWAGNSILGLSEPKSAEFLDIFILMCIYNFTLSWVKHEKSFITSGLGCLLFLGRHKKSSSRREMPTNATQKQSLRQRLAEITAEYENLAEPDITS